MTTYTVICTSEEQLEEALSLYESHNGWSVRQIVVIGAERVVAVFERETA